MTGKLTNDLLKDAVSRDKKYWLADELNNLYVLVMPGGAKYWKFRFRYNGKSDEVTVGKPYPKMLLPAARAEARRLQVLLDSGVNPREERRKKRLAMAQSAANTFGEAANAWHAFRSQAWKPRTANQVREYLDLDLLPALGRYPIDQISPQMLAALIHKIRDRGAPDVAKKARQWLAAIYKYARGNRWASADPAQDLHAITLIKADVEPHAHVPYGTKERCRQMKVASAT